MNTSAVNKKLTDKEKIDLLRNVLGDQYNSAGKNLPFLKKTIDVIGYIDTSMGVADLIPYANTIISSGRLMTFVGTSTSLLSIFLFPVSAMISIINAYQVGHQMYAYRAIAYTITAWVFNRPIPQASQRILLNIRQGGVVANQSAVLEYQQLWQRTSRLVLNNIETELRAKGIPADAMKLTLRTAGQNNEQILCELIMKGFEGEMSNITNITWKRNYSIKFPS